jgi:hypothetical protein
MQVWFNRPLGAATLGCGAGVGLSLGAGLCRAGTSVTCGVEGLRHDTKGAETVAQSVARRKLRREKVLGGTAAGAGEFVETEIRPLSFMIQGWAGWSGIASLSTSCRLKNGLRFPKFGP